AYQVPVFNYVLRLVGDRALAEDLTQEVFLRVYQGLPKFSLRSKFTTWLFQVTKNRVLDELRASERRPRALVALEDIPPLEVVDAPFERLEAIDAVWRAVEGLNVDLKMALLLRRVNRRNVGVRSGAVGAVAIVGLSGGAGSVASACATSAADAGRNSGSRASVCMTSASSSSGTDGSTSRTGTIVPVRCFSASS